MWWQANNMHQLQRCRLKKNTLVLCQLCLCFAILHYRVSCFAILHCQPNLCFLFSHSLACAALLQETWSLSYLHHCKLRSQRGVTRFIRLQNCPHLLREKMWRTRSICGHCYNEALIRILPSQSLDHKTPQEYIILSFCSPHNFLPFGWREKFRCDVW